MKRHEITAINFERKQDGKGLLGFVSFIIDGFKFTDLAVFSRLEGGVRISWPERQRGIKRIKSALPISDDSIFEIESQVFAHMKNNAGEK